MIQIEGESDKTIFISTLLHGNETSGILALNRFLKQYLGKKPPHNLCIFYGNTLAASRALRHLPEQPDWNRIWCPQELPESFEKMMAQELLSFVSQLPLMACIDIHNNTGNNPPYGCINHTGMNFQKLSALFDEKMIYFTEPHQVLSMCLAPYAPSMTIEAGLPGEVNGIDLIVVFLNKLMNISSIDEMEAPTKTSLYQTVARVIIPKDLDIDFEFSRKSHNHYSLLKNIEDFNFHQISKQTLLGFCKKPFLVTDDDGRNVFDQYFEFYEGELRTKIPITPAMLTKNQYVLKSDCLCYIMKEIKEL